VVAATSPALARGRKGGSVAYNRRAVSLALRLSLSRHQRQDRVTRAGAFVEHPPYLVSNRHLDSVALGQVEHGSGRFDPFGNHVHLGDDLVERTTLAQFAADPIVAALRANTGGDQVSHTGQAGERERLATQGNTQTGQFR